MSEDLSELQFDILKQAVNLARFERVRTVAAMRTRLLQANPGQDADVDAALLFWANYEVSKGGESYPVPAY